MTLHAPARPAPPEAAAHDGISVVVPVYNGSATLRELLERLHKSLAALPGPFEVILVNDGSTDASWELITQLQRRRKWLRAIDLMKNYGQHNALLCGIRGARYGVIVTMDDDLQHSPEDIGRLLDRLREGYDVVYGTYREVRQGWRRRLVTAAAKWVMQRAMGVRMVGQVSAFRAFRSELKTAFLAYDGPYVSVDVLLSWGTQRFGSTTVDHSARRAGRSNYTFRKLVTFAMDMTTGFSAWPLRAASAIGFFFTLFGGLVMVYVVTRYLVEGSPVPGFPFLASIASLFSGAQLFALGVIGEYLARLHFRSMGRPPAIVRRELGAGAWT